MSAPILLLLALTAFWGSARAGSDPVWSTDSIYDSKGRPAGAITQTSSLGEPPVGGILGFACLPGKTRSIERVMLHFGVKGDLFVEPKLEQRISGATQASIEVDDKNIGVFPLTPRPATPATHFVAANEVGAFIDILTAGRSILFRTSDDAGMVHEVAFSLQGSARAIAETRDACSRLSNQLEDEVNVEVCEGTE